MTIPVHVALVDDERLVDRADLQEVAAALNEQVQSDFAPVWHVRATVGVWDKPPAGTWAIHLRRNIGEPGALGYHADQHLQPYAMVDVDAGEWTVTASHELLEMLADPFGNRMHEARVPAGVRPHDVGLLGAHVRVRYLVEVADPPEATSYLVGDVPVSDFITPDWYRTSAKPLSPAAHVSALVPRMVGPGGYVSLAVGDHWWQAFADERGNLELADLGRFDREWWGSLREFTDARARERKSGG